MSTYDSIFTAPTKTNEQDAKLFNETVDKIIGDLTVNADVSAEDTKESSTLAIDQDELARFVHECFASSDAARKDIEDKWLAALRQYKGLYDEDTLGRMAALRSKAFMRMTRTKVRTVDSRLSDLLFPANGDKNWAIEPTPIPEFTPKKIDLILNMYQQETGKVVTKEELELLLMQEAKNQSRKMSRVINDQLSELRYREIMRDVIHSGNVYGTGILKGPLVSISENKQYYKKVSTSGQEEWILQEYDQITPFVENVRVWDVYPDMEATFPSDCRYIIQRRKMDKHALLGLSKRSDFSGTVITNHVAEHPNGNYTKKSFEHTLTSLGDVIDSGVADGEKSKKYEVLEFWGYVDASDMEKFGVEIPERLAGQIEVAANIWILDNKVIKASLTPMDGVKWPYFFYYYDKDETCLFGEGIPGIMSDVQQLINSALRAMIDNAAISAGPQVEVNMDLLSEDEDPHDIYPFKVWLRTGEGLEAANPAIRVLNLPSHTPEFERMIELFRSYGDEVTSIPRYMWGEASGGAGRTASGLSMLMGSANITIKDQVKNFDDGITKPFITAMYYWNMQFNVEDDAKGDYAVIARGTSSLIAKEIRSQALINFAQMTNNPVDMPLVNRAKIIQSIAESLDLLDDNLVKSEREIEVAQQQATKQAEEERQWMTAMVEAAREGGVSPGSLIDSLKSLRLDLAKINSPQDQGQNGSQQQQSTGAGEAVPGEQEI